MHGQPHPCSPTSLTKLRLIANVSRSQIDTFIVLMAAVLKQTYLYRTSCKRTCGAMGLSRRSKLRLLLFLVCFPPVLSERRFLRPSSNVKMPDPPFPLEYKQLSLDFSHQLIGVKFLFHAACTLCLLALSVVAFLYGIFRVVFWSCNSAVCLATDSLQVKYSKR